MSSDKHHDAGRRRLLNSAVSASTVALIPLASTSCSSSSPAVSRSAPVFSPENQATLNAFVDRIIPADEHGPGAVQTGVPDFINRALGEWRQEDIPVLAAGLAQLDRAARETHGISFVDLDPDRMDRLMEAMEDGELDVVDDGPAMFSMLRRLAVEGMFSDPYYGGNQGYAGWDLIGYPGAVMASPPELQDMGQRLQPLHVSAYGADYDGD